MLSHEDHTRCFEMFRRLAAQGFDGDAAEWLIKHRALAEEFTMEHFDLLAPDERMHLYHLVFWLFRGSFKPVMDRRLQLERDPECRNELVQIEARQREQPYKSHSSGGLLAECEKDLEHEGPFLRCIAAMGIYALTRKTKKVIPVLLAILHNRGGEKRELAAEILGQIKPLNRQAVQELRAIASDPGDPVRTVAQEALRRQKGFLKSISARLLGLGGERP